jgi:RNA polymerase sigma factor (sigma-70 family)
VTRAKVAIIDDDRTYLRSVARTLSRNTAFEIHAMSDDDAVARQWGASEFDLIMLDVFMPRTSGIQLCKAVRSSDRDTTIVVMSGAMTDEIARAARVAGATQSMVKPDDVQSLVELTERYVAGVPDADSYARETAGRVREHVDVARNIARSLARRYKLLLDRGDIEGYAMVGLCEAAQRYDQRRGEPFIAFAARRIRGAVLDQLRRVHPHDVRIDEERMPADDTLAHQVEHVDSLARLAVALRQLAPLELAVLALRYEQELAVAEIGERLALTPARVEQLHRRALARLRAALAREQSRS